MMRILCPFCLRASTALFLAALISFVQPLAAGETQDSAGAQAQAAWDRAQEALADDDPYTAVTELREAVELAPGNTRYNIGLSTVMMEIGQPHEAAVILKSIVAHARSTGDEAMLARMLYLQGRALMEGRAGREAIKVYAEAIPLLDDIGMVTEAADARNQLGWLSMHLKDVGAAQALFAGALAKPLKGDSKHIMLQARLNLGIALIGQGRLLDATPELELAVDGFREVGRSGAQSVAMIALGLVQSLSGDLVGAYDNLRDAKKTLAGNGESLRERGYYLVLRPLRFLPSDIKAIEVEQRGESALFDRVGKDPQSLQVLSDIAVYRVRGGDFASAERMARRGLDMSMSEGPVAIARAKRSLGFVLLAAGSGGRVEGCELLKQAYGPLFEAADTQAATSVLLLQSEYKCER